MREKMENLEVERILAGAMRTNCYIVSDKVTKEALIIDPADEADKIKNSLLRGEKRPIAILLTHGHFDHIKAAKELKKEYDIKIYCMEEERKVLENPEYNLSSLFGTGFQVSADSFLKDGEQMQIGPFFITVIHTPGHTVGSACYYITKEDKTEGILMSGDTLFHESVGRTDFPTGSASSLVHSVKEKLFCLDDSTPVYPGHDSFTTIGYEKQNNPCVGGEMEL